MEPAIRKPGRGNTSQRLHSIEKQKESNIKVESPQSSISTIPITNRELSALDNNDSIPLGPSSDLLRVLHSATVDVIARGNEVDTATANQLDGAFDASALDAIANLMIEYAGHLLTPTLNHLQEAMDVESNNNELVMEMNEDNQA